MAPDISVDIGELVAVGRDLTYFESGKKTQIHSCLPFVSGVKVRALELYYVGPSTQHPALVLCIFRISGGIRYLIKWGVKGWRLVLILTSTCCVSWGKSSALSLPEHRDQVTCVF